MDQIWPRPVKAWKQDLWWSSVLSGTNASAADFFFTVVGFLGGASRDWTCSHAQLDGYLGNLRSQVEALSFWSRSLDRSGAVFVVWQGALSGWGAGLKD